MKHSSIACSDLLGCVEGCPVPAEIERQRLGCSGDQATCNCRRCFEARCEAEAYFEALDYAFDSTKSTAKPADLPVARIVRRKA